MHRLDYESQRRVVDSAERPASSTDGNILLDVVGGVLEFVLQLGAEALFSWL